MRRTAKWAIVLLIAAFLGAGIAQVGATMSAKHTATVQPTAVASPAGCSGGGCKGGGCGMAKKPGACSQATVAAKPATAASCPMSKDGKACADCDKHQPCDKAGATAAKCPAKDAGNVCTDCSQHPNCPDAKSTAAKPASK